MQPACFPYPGPGPTPHQPHTRASRPAPRPRSLTRACILLLAYRCAESDAPADMTAETGSYRWMAPEVRGGPLDRSFGL